MKKFILYASAFVVFLALVGWLIYPINLVVYASVLGTVTVILLIKTNERREEAITKIVGSSLRRTIFRSVRYTWITIVGLNIFSLVVLPVYFYDATVRISNGIWNTPTEEIFHITDSGDAEKFQQIINRIEQWYNTHPCVIHICDVPNPVPNPPLKLYEAYSIIDTFRLMGSNWFAPGYPYHYWRGVEYQGNYYSIHVDIPYFEFVFNSLIISLLGSASIALAWVRFGQSNNKQRDFVQA